MWWFIGVIIGYLVIGIVIGAVVAMSAGEPIVFTKNSMIFMLTWPRLFISMIFQ